MQNHYSKEPKEFLSLPSIEIMFSILLSYLLLAKFCYIYIHYTVITLSKMKMDFFSFFFPLFFFQIEGRSHEILTYLELARSVPWYCVLISRCAIRISNISRLHWNDLIKVNELYPIRIDDCVVGYIAKSTVSHYTLEKTQHLTLYYFNFILYLRV